MSVALPAEVEAALSGDARYDISSVPVLEAFVHKQVADGSFHLEGLLFFSSCVVDIAWVFVDSDACSVDCVCFTLTVLHQQRTWCC
jgi:hypothetical protein